MTFEQILTYFPGQRKPNGKGGFMVPCPAHTDKTPSLSISQGNGSGPLFKCFADCRTEDILTAVGLTWQDVLPPREDKRREAPARKASPPGTVTRYDIRNPAGEIVAVHVREDQPDGKRIWWELPDGTKKLDRPLVDLPLYGIEQLTTAPEGSPVTVCEGEKAADALRNNGKLAVGTVTGAAGMPGDDALRPLLEHTVYLWPDNDKPGRDHMDRIGAALIQLGRHDVRMIDWKGALEKGDAADLFALEGAMDEYDAIMDEAKPTTLETEPVAVDNKPAPLFVPVAQLLENPRKPKWLVRGLLETPSTAMIFGPSGGGKSFIAVDLAVAAATNGHWMGKRVVSGGPVYYLAGEGHTGLERRFYAWQLHHGIERLPENILLSVGRIELDIAGALKVEEEVERMSKETGTPPALIVIDTLARALPAGKDENSAKDMSEFTNEVDRIRDRFRCVVVIVHHSGLADNQRARGSSAIKATLDAELCVSMSGATRQAQWTKLKDQSLDSHGQEFILKVVLLGEEEDTEEGENPFVTSCVAEWGGRTTTKAGNTVTKAERLGLDTLSATIADGTSTTLEPWRAAFYAKHWGDNDEVKRKAFLRIRASLASKDLIAINGDKYSSGTGRDIAGHCPTVSQGH